MRVVLYFLFARQHLMNTTKHRAAAKTDLRFIYNTEQLVRELILCTSGSVVEYRLAKARVAGSNPVSCSLINLAKVLIYCTFAIFILFCDVYVCVRSCVRWGTGMVLLLLVLFYRSFQL